MGNNKTPKIRFKGFTDDWEQRELGAYYFFKNGLNKGKEFFGYGTPIVNFTDVFKNRGLCLEELSGKVNVTADELKNYKVQQGDIFFTRTSETIDEIGYPSVALSPMKSTVFSGFVLRARAIQDDPLENKFKKYVFFTEAFRDEMVKKSSMTTRALTSGTAIKQMEFKFPNEKIEQAQIGELFTTLDNLITCHQRKYDKLTNVKKSMLEKMFPKNGEEIPEIRFKGFTDPWEQRELGEVLLLLKDGTHGTHIDVVDGLLLLSAKNIKNGEVSWDDTDRRISQSDYNSIHSKFCLQSGDILLTIVGSIGETAILKDACGLTFQRSVAFLRPNNELKSQFLYSEIQTAKFKKELNDRKSTSAQPGIYLGDLSVIPVIYPKNIVEQTKIGEYFSNLDNLITCHQRELEKLKNIKKSLLEKMFV